MRATTKQSGAAQPSSQDERTAPPGIDKFAARLIRRKARELVRRAGYSSSDTEDIEQELTLVLLRRLGKFDPSVAHYNAFVTTVVERYAATILQHGSAEMRTHRRNGGSLNVTVTDDDGHTVELVATICSSQQSLRTGQHQLTHEEASDLMRDVADVLEQLPPQLRELCERLKHDSISDVARELGVSRKTLYRRLTRIRERFEKAGMRDYL